jgi:hypothetical protein
MRLRVRQRRVRRGRKHLLEDVRVDSFSHVAGGRESNATLRVVPLERVQLCVHHALR